MWYSSTVICNGNNLEIVYGASISVFVLSTGTCRSLHFCLKYSYTVIMISVFIPLCDKKNKKNKSWVSPYFPKKIPRFELRLPVSHAVSLVHTIIIPLPGSLSTV